MTDELGLEDIDVDESEATSHIASLANSPEKSKIPASARSELSDWDTTVADETPRDGKALGESSKKANPTNEVKAKPADKAIHDSDSQWDSDDDNEIPVLPSEAGKIKQLEPSGVIASDSCGSEGNQDAGKTMSGSVCTESDIEAKPSTSSLFEPESLTNCVRKEMLFLAENPVKCDQEEKLEEFMTVGEESCENEMIVTTEEQDDDDDDDDEWDNDDDEKEEAKEEEMKEEGKEKKKEEEKIEEEKKMKRDENKKGENEEVVEKNDEDKNTEEWKIKMDEEKKKEEDIADKEEKKEEEKEDKEEKKKEEEEEDKEEMEAKKKKKIGENMVTNEEEEEKEWDEKMEKVKTEGETPPGLSFVRNLESSQTGSHFAWFPLASSAAIETEADHEKSCLAAKDPNSATTDAINKKFLYSVESSETKLPDVLSSGTSLTGDSFIIESGLVIERKETPENTTELFDKKKKISSYDNNAFGTMGCSKEKLNAKDKGKIQNPKEKCNNFEGSFSAERLLPAKLYLEASSADVSLSQNFLGIMCEANGNKTYEVKVSKSEVGPGHKITSQQIEKKASSEVAIVQRVLSQISQSDVTGFSQKVRVQAEDTAKETAKTQVSLMYDTCLSPLEKMFGQSEESSLDDSLENQSKGCFDAEKKSFDDLTTCKEVRALKDNATENQSQGNQSHGSCERDFFPASSTYERDPLGKSSAASLSVSITDVSDIDDLSEVKHLLQEENATEDEEESTWEKERKLAKKNSDKQKTEVTDSVKTENEIKLQEKVPDSTSSIPEVKGEHKEKEDVLSSLPSERNGDREPSLSGASSSSSQQKQAPVSSSGRIPLISTVIPLSVKMSQEESTSDTDEPLSPIEGPRSTARSVSLNTDMNNVIRLQEMIRDGQRKLESERSAKTLLENKRKALETERAKLLDQLQVVTHEKFNLDQLKIDLESKVRHLEYELSEETEKRKNTDVLYEKTKEQLTRKEEQCLQLTEAKQKTETSLKNEQKDKVAAVAVIKQLEDENESLKRQLNEKNIFVVQDEVHADHQRRSIIQSSAMVGGDEGYPQSLPTLGASAELYATQLEMNRERERAKDTVEQLMHENEELRKLNKDLTEKWSRGEDALTHASLYYNLDVVQLKADNDRLSSHLEKEVACKEELTREVNSLKLQLSSLTAELHAAHDAKAELERQRQRHSNDFSRLSEQQNQELSSTKSLNKSQSQQLSEVLPKMQKLESELVVANTMLTERTTQLTILQKDLEKRCSAQEALDDNYQRHKEENIRLEAKVESLQERLSEVQEELRIAKQSSELKRLNGEQPGDLATLLGSLKTEHDRTKVNLEDRNASLIESLSKVKEELKSAERGRLNTEDEKRRLQALLSETQKQQLASETSLQMASQARQQLEVERSQLKIEIDRLKDKLEEDRQRILRLDQRILELTQQVKMAESSAANSHEQFNKESNSLQGLLKVKHDLGESLHRMEVENAKLEAALNHERQKVTMLQKDCSESKQNQMTLEEDIQNFKNHSHRLEEKLNEAAGLKTQATQEADDNRALWESEIKSRSKLGLRLAQLEREKRDLDSKVQEEKRRVRRALELKKSSEEKLEGEQGRNGQLQKELSVLKVHLKAAKKRIKELQAQRQTVARCQRCRTNGVDTDSMDNGFEAENIYQNGHSPIQLDFAKHQFQYEPGTKDHRHSRPPVSDFDQLRNMENLRMNGSIYLHDQTPHQMVGSNYLVTSEIDHIRDKLKSEAQMILNQKLQEVNCYLDDQAKARERLDRIRDISEAEMRKEFEKARKEMLEEIAKVKHNFEGNMSVQKGRRSNETQQQMKDLYEREVKLRERLLDRIDNAYSKVTNSTIDCLRPEFTDLKDGGALLDGELAKSSVRHGLNDTTMNNLKYQLDKSIARHMAAAADDHTEGTVNPLLLDPVGSGRNSSNGDTTSILHRNFLL